MFLILSEIIPENTTIHTDNYKPDSELSNENSHMLLALLLFNLIMKSGIQVFYIYIFLNRKDK